MGGLEQWVVALADEWWVHPVMLALATIDGFFPVVPSESVIVSLASLSSSTGRKAGRTP